MHLSQSYTTDDTYLMTRVLTKLLYASVPFEVTPVSAVSSTVRVLPGYEATLDEVIDEVIREQP